MCEQTRQTGILAHSCRVIQPCRVRLTPGKLKLQVSRGLCIMQAMPETMLPAAVACEDTGVPSAWLTMPSPAALLHAWDLQLHSRFLACGGCTWIREGRTFRGVLAPAAASSCCGAVCCRCWV